MIQEQFVSYDIALALKKLGFNQPCFCYFNENNELSNFDSNMFDEDKINSKLPDIDDYSYEDKMFDFDFCTVPLYQQVFEFFRSKGIYVSGIDSCINDDEKIRIYFHHAIYNDKDECIFDNNDDYNTYEEAQIACINKLIELVYDR